MTAQPKSEESQYQPKHQRQGRALCLSGGGFRAALFHLGALRRLNELGLLSRMQAISSVSCGSITNGLLAFVWRDFTPDTNGVFSNFHEVFEEKLRKFCGQDLRTSPLLWNRLDPVTGRYYSETITLPPTFWHKLITIVSYTISGLRTWLAY